ncbi:MAG: prolyl oligopeptidase family serine peptidase [bacterium]|nr:prolyl oligopeptidase family serine peptidase [bacterium]
MALASWGFIVAAPPHPGNTRADGFGACLQAFADSARNRVPDVRFTLDSVLAESTTRTSPFAKRIRPTGIGITGGSYGGFTTLWSAQQDTRFTAAMANVPGGADVIAPLGIPLMVQGAEKDEIVPFTPESEKAFARGAGPRYLVKLLDATHLSFFDDCNGCPATNVPQGEAHRLIVRYAVPFFTRYLKNGRAAGRALTKPVAGVELTAEP